jgi:hypothetical protein
MSKRLVMFALLSLLVLSVLFGYGLSTLTHTPNNADDLSSASNQFSLDRQTLSTDTSLDELFPDQVAIYRRQTLTPLVLDSRDQLVGGATYASPDGELISLSVWQFTGWGVDRVWQSNFLTLTCGDLAGRVDLQRDVAFPYRYGNCSDRGFVYYEFQWINTDWVINASVGGFSSVEVDLQTLVDFVNSYPY